MIMWAIKTNKNLWYCSTGSDVIFHVKSVRIYKSKTLAEKALRKIYNPDLVHLCRGVDRKYGIPEIVEVQISVVNK